MRFLCLHGIGTNSHVLMNQTAPIFHAMDQHHVFNFVEGCVDCAIAPEIKAMYSANDKYFSYYDDSSESVSQALSQFETYLNEEGPFEGVIAFSQGAALISTYLINHQKKHPGSPLPIRCVVFFSGTHPIDVDTLDDDRYGWVTQSERSPSLKLPTGHIWGRSDSQYGEAAAFLSSLFDEGQRETYIHEGGHAIPSVRAQADIQGCVRVMRRVIERASIE